MLTQVVERQAYLSPDRSLFGELSFHTMIITEENYQLHQVEFQMVQQYYRCLNQTHVTVLLHLQV